MWATSSESPGHRIVLKSPAATPSLASIKSYTGEDLVMGANEMQKAAQTIHHSRHTRCSVPPIIPRKRGFTRKGATAGLLAGHFHNTWRQTDESVPL